MKKILHKFSTFISLNKSFPRWLLIVAIGGVILLLVGVGVYATLGGGSNESANIDSTTPSPTPLTVTNPTPEVNQDSSSSTVAPSCVPDQTMYVATSSGVNLRASASTNSPVLSKVPWNTSVIAGCFENDWAKVNYNDLSGYISKQYLTTTEPGIVLTGGLNVADVKLQWTVSGVDTTNGFRILRSNSADVLYPSNIDHTSTVAGNARSFWRYYLLGGGTSYFRICQITNDGGCGVYSNAVPIVEQISSKVKSINITGSTDTTINWTFSDQAANGFVVLWWHSPSVTWDGVTSASFINQIPNPIATFGTMNYNLTSGQTYYVRVCENIGGKCGTYSNEITVVAP